MTEEVGCALGLERSLESEKSVRDLREDLGMFSENSSGISSDGIGTYPLHFGP